MLVNSRTLQVPSRHSRKLSRPSQLEMWGMQQWYEYQPRFPATEHSSWSSPSNYIADKSLPADLDYLSQRQLSQGPVKSMSCSGGRDLFWSSASKTVPMQGNVDCNEVKMCRKSFTSSNMVSRRANDRTADLISLDATTLTDRMKLSIYLADQSGSSR